MTDTTTTDDHDQIPATTMVTPLRSGRVAWRATFTTCCWKTATCPPRGTSAFAGRARGQPPVPRPPDTFRAMAQWAERFGSTVTGNPHPRNGRPSVYCQVEVH